MGAAEKRDAMMPFWPAAMGREMALSYTGVGETQLREWERRGLIRFRPRGPRGAMITERTQLDEALRDLFRSAGGEVSEDLDFGD